MRHAVAGLVLPGHLHKLPAAFTVTTNSLRRQNSGNALNTRRYPSRKPADNNKAAATAAPKPGQIETSDTVEGFEIMLCKDKLSLSLPRKTQSI